jgi:hypothetical protein
MSIFKGYLESVMLDWMESIEVEVFLQFLSIFHRVAMCHTGL